MKELGVRRNTQIINGCHSNRSEKPSPNQLSECFATFKIAIFMLFQQALG